MTFSTRLAGRIIAIGVLLLAGCYGKRIRDRHDERILTMAEDHRNLYWKNRTARSGEPIGGIQAIPGFTGEQAVRKQIMYQLGPSGIIQETDAVSPAADHRLGSLAIAWREGPPVLRFWQRLHSRSVAFACPVDPYNSRPIAQTGNESDSGEINLEVFVSLRQSTLLPWVIADDYELFSIKIRHRDKQWEILEIRQLTDNREEDIQPVLHAENGLLTWTVLDGKESRVILRRLNDGDGENSEDKLISESASLPFFLPDSGDLIFVREDNGLRDFFVHEISSGKTRAATGNELSASLAIMPHSRLRERYLIMRDGEATELPEEEEAGMVEFEDLAFYALRNSPAIMRDFRKVRGAMAETVVGLVDEGPEIFFSANHLTKQYIFVDENDNDLPAVGDRATRENFLRLITGMTIPVIPNIPLRMAVYDQNLWQEEVYRQRLHRTVNEVIVELTDAYFDIVEGEAVLPLLHRAVALNKSRLRKFRDMVKNEAALPDRIILAENMLAAAITERDQVTGNIISARARLAAVLGRNPDLKLRINPELPDKTPAAPPTPEWFEGQGRINHPDLQRLNFLLMRAAAIRDMGPPSTRNDGIKVRASYGLGIDRWSELADDFISLSTDFVMPIRLPLLDNAYYDQWTAELEYFREEKFRAQGEIVYEIHAAYTDLRVLLGQLETRRKRCDFWQERMRVSQLYDRFGHLEHQQQRDLFQSLIDELEYLSDKRTVIGLQAEYFRRLVKLYAAAGVATRLLPQLFSAQEIAGKVQSLTATVEPPTPAPIGLYLWHSRPLINDKQTREEFLKFCRTMNVTRLYCFVSRLPDKEPDLVRHEQEFRDFIKLCRKQNMDVIALLGEPEWLRTYGRKEAERQIAAVIKFNQTQEQRGETAFSGIKLDVEPHALPGWHDPEGRKQLLSQYFDFLDMVSGLVAKDELSLDLPWNWHGLTIPGEKADLLRLAAERAGRITIMAYLNRPERMLAETIPILQREDLGIPIEIAFETGPVDEAGVSWFGKPLQEFLDAVAQARQNYAGFANFAGIIVHDYRNFRIMYREQADPTKQKQHKE